jgi:NTE family protein
MMSGNPSVGVALGGGGVRGFAHIPVLETIDEFGIVPAAIAGTSMGALIGALYASGKSGREIRRIVEENSLTPKGGLREIFAKKDVLLGWLRAGRLSWKGTGLLRADGYVRFLIEQMDAETFADLEVPLLVVTTDFHSGEPFVFDSGPLRPALMASMSIPGVFVPVEHEGRLLVDGGVSNNLPYDLLADTCEVTVAVDVAPTRDQEAVESPHLVDATLAMFDILVERLARAKVEAHPPSIYVHPRLVGIRVLDFKKSQEVFSQAEPAMMEFRDQLRDVATPNAANRTTGEPGHLT